MSSATNWLCRNALDRNGSSQTCCLAVPYDHLLKGTLEQIAHLTGCFFCFFVCTCMGVCACSVCLCVCKNMIQESERMSDAWLNMFILSTTVSSDEQSTSHREC